MRLRSSHTVPTSSPEYPRDGVGKAQVKKFVVAASLATGLTLSLQASAGPSTVVDDCPFLGPSITAEGTGNPVFGNTVGGFRGAPSNEDAAPIVVLSPDGRLSVDIEDLSLECVVRELGRQGEITIVLAEPAGDDDEIRRKFENLPVFHGVRRLLGQTSYVLIHGLFEDPAAPPRVLAILLLRSGPGRFGWDEKFAGEKFVGEEFADTTARDRPPAEAQEEFADTTAGDRPAAEAQDVPDPTSVADRVADLERLAARNMERLSDAMSQTLGSEEDDDAALRDLALALFDGQPPADLLAAMIAAAPTAALRRQALALLADVGQELSFEALMQAIGDPDPAISRPAAHLYAGLRMEPLVDAVGRAVRDADWRVRRSALAALEEMQEFAPVGRLAALAANDENPEVRMRALELLTLGDRQAAIDRLAPAVGDPNPKISELAEALLRDLEQELS